MKNYSSTLNFIFTEPTKCKCLPNIELQKKETPLVKSAAYTKRIVKGNGTFASEVLLNNILCKASDKA